MLIWALFRKKLGVGYGVALLSVAALAVLGAYPAMIHGDVPAIRAAVIFAALLAGASAFGDDLQKEGIRFLEYLPLRRGQIWAANALGGAILAGVAVLVASTLYAFRTELVELRPDQLVRAKSSLEILADAGAWAVFAFGATLFFSTSSTRSALGVVASVGALLLAGADMTLLELTDLEPTRLEYAPLLVLTGTLFLLASFLCFVRHPPHRTPWEVAVPVGLGALVAVVGLGLAHRLLTFERWSKLRTDEEREIASLQPAGDAGGGWLAKIEGSRSGAHLFYLEPETGAARDLGRGMDRVTVSERDLAVASRSAGRRRQFFSARFSARGLFQLSPWTAARVLSIEDGGPETAVSIMPTDESRSLGRVSSDGGWIAYEQRSARLAPGDPLEVELADVEGARRLRVRADAVNLVSVGSGGRLLLEAPRTPGSAKAHRVVDPSGGAPVALEGEILALDAAYRRAVVAREVSEGGEDGHRLVVIDLDTGRERAMPGTQDLFPTAPRPSYEPKPWTTMPRAFDEGLTRGVFGVVTQHEGRVGFSIVTLDLERGERRVVVPEDALPRFDRRKMASVEFLGYSEPDDALAYALDGTIYRVHLATGAQELVGVVPVAPGNNIVGGASLVLAPGLRAAAREKISVAVGPGDDRRHAIELLEVGRDPRELIAETDLGGEGARPAFWLDDQRLVVFSGSAVFIASTDGAPPRQVWALPE